MSKPILIVGGCGYIGSMLSKRYLERGFPIVVVDNLLHGQGHLVNNIIFHENCYEFVNTDVMSIPEHHIKNTNTIFWLAAHVGPLCNKDPDEARRVNVESLKWLVPQLTNQKLIYLCSSSGYGKADKECTEQEPFSSLSIYAQTKEEGEKIVRQYENSCSFRLATVWGRSLRMRFDLLVNNLVWDAVKKQHITIFQGDYKRSFVNIDDVVNLLFSQWQIRGIYNVGNDNCTKTTLIEKIKNYIEDLGISVKYFQDPDERSYYLNNDAIKARGFKFSRSLDSHLGELIYYYKLLSEDCFNMKAMRNI